MNNLSQRYCILYVYYSNTYYNIYYLHNNVERLYIIYDWTGYSLNHEIPNFIARISILSVCVRVIVMRGSFVECVID